LASVWSNVCDSFAIAEHGADEQVPRTHTHSLIIEPEHDNEWFRKTIKATFPGINGRKDFRIFTKTQEEKLPISRQGLRYLAKGDSSRLKLIKLFSKEEVDTAVASWVNTPTETSSDSRTDMDIIDEIKDELMAKNIIKNREFFPTESSLVTSYTFQSHMKTDFIKILNKHLRINKKKTNLFELERWVVTIMREDPEQPLWSKIFSKLDL